MSVLRERARDPRRLTFGDGLGCSLVLVSAHEMLLEVLWPHPLQLQVHAQTQNLLPAVWNTQGPEPMSSGMYTVRRSTDILTKTLRT